MNVAGEVAVGLPLEAALRPAALGLFVPADLPADVGLRAAGPPHGVW